MSIFSIADLHLSLAADKPMDVFGSRWKSYTEKIETRWRAVVNEDDTVIVPGDISWAMTLEEARTDLAFIESLPGRKLIGKGNHDYWWATMSKMRQFTEACGFKTIDFLYNNAFECEDYIVCGTRGWYVEERLQNASENADYQKIVAREATRLDLSLTEAAALRGQSDKTVLCYLHFPPVFRNFVCRELVDTMHKHGVKHCYFGHIHGVYNVPRSTVFEGINMTLISADFLDFIPMITMPYDY